MNIYSLIEESLQAVLQNIMGIIGYEDTLVITSHQNGLEPVNTYCVLNILGMHKQGMRDEGTWVIDVEMDGEEVSVLESITHYRLDTQLSFIGKNSTNVGFDFKHNLENNRKIVDTLSYENYGILRRSDIRRVPQKRESTWVDACNYDVSFSFSIYTREAYDWVEYIILKDNDSGERFTIRVFKE